MRIKTARILNSIIPAVQEYLKMPTQEEFDALVQAGFEAEEARFALWEKELRQSRREREARGEDLDLFQS